MKRSIGIKAKTTIYAIIPIVVCFSIICSVLFVSLFRAHWNRAGVELQLFGLKYENAFERKINHALSYLTIVAAILELQYRNGIHDRELLQRILWNAFDSYDNIHASSIYFEPNIYDGKDAAYIGTKYGTALSGRICFHYYRVDGQTRYLPEALGNEIEFSLPGYLDAKTFNAPIYTEPAVYNIDGADILMFVISYPIRGPDNEFIGAVSVDIYLEDIYAQLIAETIYETGYILIGNDKGQIICSPRFEDIGKTREEAGLLYALPSDVEAGVFFSLSSILNRKNTLVTIKALYFPQLDSRFYISVSVPYGEIGAKGIMLLVFVMTLGMIVVSLIAFILYTNMKEPNKTLRAMQNILNGIDGFVYVSVPETGELLFMNEKMKKAFNIAGDVSGQYCYKVLQGGCDTICAFCPCHQLDKDPDAVIVWEEYNTITKRYYYNTDCYIGWITGSKVHLQHSVDITDIKVLTEAKIKAEHESQQLMHEKKLAEKTSRMKSVFLASVSHEIRTPMHGIIGFSELALDDTIPLKTRDYLSKIKTSAESLLMIINDILDMSKIEAGKIELEKIPFDISDVFKLCRVIASPKAREKGLTLFCYAEPSIGRLLLGDPTRLRQILLNLLSNAIKFTNSGMVKLLSAITERTDNSITVHFEVKDSGIGMTPEQLSRIFQPFMQADDSTMRKYGGTGLGLTITKNFVELMGGTLEVESSAGLGSRFSFDLTFETIDAVTRYSQDISINSGEKPIFAGEILVCEDNALNQMVIRDHLAKVGLQSVIAGNGRIGVDLVKSRIEKGEKPFDLIFMDIHMPEMDGLEAARRLIEIGGIDTPIVALTANVMANDRETYFESGMDDCLSKPFVAHELWTCLLKYFKPVKMLSVKRDFDIAEEEDQRIEMIAAFVKSNQTTIKDINDAIKAGNIKLAHRLAHTLKGVAGIVGKTMLIEAAWTVEQYLSAGKTEFLSDQMSALESALNAALADLTPLVENYTSKVAAQRTAAVLWTAEEQETAPESASESFHREDALKLLESLDLLLKADSFDSLNFVKYLNAIPGMEQLADQVDNLKFRQARETLTAIRQNILDGEQA
ncbi:MAG: ATP-binding protein [Treponema sp.]|nr:ATP-binding protein [Treponema sp.]